MDVFAWLLEADPSIRWQALLDLDDDVDGAAAERARVATEGWGARLLALQDADGYWSGQEYGEDGDRRSTIWSLQLLRRLGVDPEASVVRNAIARVRDGVTWREHGDLPFFHGEVEECPNGGVLALASYFGVLGEGSDRIVGRLLDEQLPDGGWNCEPRKESERSSFDSTICVLEGLLAYEQAVGDEAADGDVSVVGAARRRGEEYLLERNLFRRRSTGEIVLPRYANLAFPPYWFYDVLRALDHFRAAGASPDARIAPAVDLLLAERGDDGRWAAGTPHDGEVYFAVDAPEGEPSRWNTLRALRVLRWIDAAAV
ncbi:hypothetical protein [Agromyces sp. NPDC058126]|uniref:hypothetical protein n=1 Tax=Agromyces sp. NPDC058126 TaxID=3346350 RepID=UPI0036DB64F2